MARTRTYRIRTCACGRETKRLFYTNVGKRCGDCIRKEGLTRTGAPVYRSRAVRLGESISEIRSALESSTEADIGELEDLKEEMENWRDGMSGTGLENTDKFSEVEECADGLDNGISELESALETWNEAVGAEFGGEECSHCSVGVCAGSDDACPEECFDCREAALEDTKSEVESALDELESIDFPGMY